MKILVTGGLGFIGSHTVVELQNEGFDVIAVDNLSNSSIEVVDGIERITGKKPIFEKLEKNLMDVVLEEQAKLGFRREKIRLYYPLSTLNHLLGTQDTAEQMEVTLAGQPESMTIKLGKLAVSRKGDRFCLCIPEEGSAYVHEHFAEKGFIYELIRLIGQHDCKMEDIRQLFLRYSENIYVEEMRGEDFDVMIRFPEEMGDPYCYCFRDEGCHVIYHRFLPEDYADLMKA